MGKKFYQLKKSQDNTDEIMLSSKENNRTGQVHKVLTRPVVWF